MAKKLTEKSEAVKKREAKEDLFCVLYTTPNSPTYKHGTKSAIKASYAEKSAHVTASKLLKKPKIIDKIKKILEKRTAKLEFGAQEVLAELKKLATSNLGDFFDDQGLLKNWKDLTRDQTACLEAVDFKHFAKEGDDRLTIAQVHKLKFWSKLKALELYGQHLSLFKNELADPYEGQETNEEYL